MHFKAPVYWNSVCSIVQRVGFVHALICREPAAMHMNYQGLKNLYESVMFCIQH